MLNRNTVFKKYFPISVCFHFFLVWSGPICLPDLNRCLQILFVHFLIFHELERLQIRPISELETEMGSEFVLPSVYLNLWRQVWNLLTNVVSDLDNCSFERGSKRITSERSKRKKVGSREWRDSMNKRKLKQLSRSNSQKSAMGRPKAIL